MIKNLMFMRILLYFYFFGKLIKINFKIQFSNTNLKNSNTRDEFQIMLKFIKKFFLKKISKINIFLNFNPK